MARRWRTSWLTQTVYDRVPPSWATQARQPSYLLLLACLRAFALAGLSAASCISWSDLVHTRRLVCLRARASAGLPKFTRSARISCGLRSRAHAPTCSCLWPARGREGRCVRARGSPWPARVRECISVRAPGTDQGLVVQCSRWCCGTAMRGWRLVLLLPPAPPLLLSPACLPARAPSYPPAGARGAARPLPARHRHRHHPYHAEQAAVFQATAPAGWVPPTSPPLQA